MVMPIDTNSPKHIAEPQYHGYNFAAGCKQHFRDDDRMQRTFIILSDQVSQPHGRSAFIDVL